MRSIDDVLRQVANGELSPTEALAALEAADDAGAAPPGGHDTPPPGHDTVDLGKAPPPPPDEADRPGPAGGHEGPPGHGADEHLGPGRATPLRVVRVRTPASHVEVYADPAVAEVLIADGSPLLRREGDAMVIEHAVGQFHGPGARFGFVGHLPRKLASTIPLPGLDGRIVVRMNPALLLDVEVTAVSLHVWGCEGGLRLRLAASSAKLDRVSGPLTIDALSSSVKGSVCVTGEGRIHCESSSVKLGLLPGSDVRIKARNRLGKVVLPRGRGRGGHGHNTNTNAHAVVGQGNGLLVIEGTMSSVMIGDDL
jgi:hypothetical protein